MPRLRPFSATRYTSSAGEPERLLAPPYDVIDAESAAALRALSPHNAVRLVLPEGPSPDRYELAAGRLRSWLEEGILATDSEPGVYLYEQSFPAAGVVRAGEAAGVLTRTAIVAALEATPFSEGEVLPHEETHRGPREDRLALMRACRAQLSPVFLVARDPAGEVERTVAAAREAVGRAVLRARTEDGILHVLWRVPARTEAPLLGAAGALPLLIADGHHRYETALAFAADPGAPPGASSLLACIVGERDPGLAVLPTHRVLRHPPAGAAGWRPVLEAEFDLERLEEPGGGRREPEGEARAAGRGAMVASTPEGAFRLRPRPGALRRAGLEDPPAVVAFDRLVLRGGFGAGPDEAVGAGLLSYHRDAAGARRDAGDAGAAFFLPPLDPGRVWELARAGHRMPPKSTYFWPKIPSGLFFRLLG